MIDALPNARFAELHGRVIHVDLERTFAALHAMHWSELPMTRPLFVVRGLGSLADAPVLSGAFAPVHEDPPRYTTGAMIGKPWAVTSTASVIVDNLAEFRQFREPGWLKFAMEWVLSPLDERRTFVETATLCEPTDAVAARRFDALLADDPGREWSDAS